MGKKRAAAATSTLARRPRRGCGTTSSPDDLSRREGDEDPALHHPLELAQCESGSESVNPSP